jgi:AraC-like DNA-binding protein
LIVQNGKRAQVAWLQMPLVIVCTTWLLGLIRTLTAALSDAERPVFAIAALVDIGVTIGCVYLIVKKISTSESNRATSAAVDSPPGTGDSKYAKCQIDEAVRSRIARKLKKTFGEEAIYCDPNLSLGSLSRRLSENEHYVSQVLNQELGTSFYELVSRYRITHAQRMLTESPGRSVLEIALAVGFNAKSTFNSAFRRHTGMTPREFRARTREGHPAQTPAATTDSRL